MFALKALELQVARAPACARGMQSFSQLAARTVSTLRKNFIRVLSASHLSIGPGTYPATIAHVPFSNPWDTSVMPTIIFGAGNHRVVDPVHPRQGTNVAVSGEGFSSLIQVTIRVVDKRTDRALAHAVADTSAEGSFQWGYEIAERVCFEDLLAVVRADSTELTATAEDVSLSMSLPKCRKGQKVDLSAR
jgi:hypothetical protein